MSDATPSNQKPSAGSTILLPVFLPAVIVMALLVIGTISNPTLAAEAFSATLAYIISTFGWFYMLSVAFFLVFIVSIALTKWGRSEERRVGKEFKGRGEMEYYE